MMIDPVLPRAPQARYSNAPYSFFQVRNFDDARNEFMASRTTQPQFTYTGLLNESFMERRRQTLEMTAADALDVADQSLSLFIERRLKETELLLTFLKLRKSPKDKAAFDQFRTLMTVLHGNFDPELFRGILWYLEQRAQKTDKLEVFNRLKSLTADNKSATNKLYQPSSKTFAYYREVLQNSKHPINRLRQQKPLIPLTRTAVLDYLNWALKQSGADREGWSVRDGKSGANVMVSRRHKKIIVGAHYLPHTPMRLQQVAAHEVFVHIRHALAGDSHESANAEEGIAILAEQLLAGRFMYRRLLRYFAAALAWGVDGKPRTFRETYNVVVLAFRIVGKHDEEEAGRRAFSECVRVYRGGVPEVAGAAYIKDKIYLETNLMIWRKLEDNKLSPEQFLDFIDGQIQL